ncbi:LysR substrate-binding domain-containing protein [Mesorhizobium sp.]|uniref:LysR substrate-binding domain-containing protein n=1 Tax=Mesorhizobium sp. TaxID=1871066 RepID=UPI000FEA5DA7|nr:LysR substrate-binding domain-containing protein [Mesorhizobium sp.]RWB66278.1 MAG: LysR family transcriptional regulator [Mesorhizobium sp.]
MVRRYYGLPPLTTLAVFEAAARHCNFSLAAQELNVTPGAVSRQVKALEDELNTRLFIRQGTHVQLTQTGEDLFLSLASTFARCSEAVEAARSDQRTESVTLACTDAFANFWLMPRITDFWEKYPGITLNHLISDDVRDFRRTEVDLRIRPGNGVWANETSELLFPDTIYPVCGLDFAKRHDNVRDADLPTLPLLHMDWIDPEWPRWDDFFRSVGIAHNLTQGRRFGKYVLQLLAAEANQGVAMGWDAFVRPLILQGRLVRFTSLSVPAPIGYYLTWNDSRALSRPALQLKAWIVEQSRSTRQSLA